MWRTVGLGFRAFDGMALDRRMSEQFILRRVITLTALHCIVSIERLALTCN